MCGSTLSAADRLDALVEANIQFHWGANSREVVEAASRFEALGINPALARDLEGKAGRMATIDALRPADTTAAMLAYLDRLPRWC